MFGNQRFERDVGQNIAAVNDEGFFPENAFDIFDSAPGFEQVRFMSERNGMTVVTVPREKFMKQGQQPMRVDHTRMHACRNQMLQSPAPRAPKLRCFALRSPMRGCASTQAHSVLPRACCGRLSASLIHDIRSSVQIWSAGVTISG